MAKTLHPVPGRKKSIALAMLSGTIVFFIAAVMIFPQEAITAARDGRDLWFHILLPAQLPFFIGAELLRGLGVVRFIGVLFTPLMQYLFALPGESSFVWAMGLASGYPMGADLTARLRREAILNKEESERLLLLANNAGPLFMLGSVAVGMYSRPEYGAILLFSHYTGNLTATLLATVLTPKTARRKSIASCHIGAAWRAMVKAREDDGRPFGRILGDAVRHGMSTLLLVGGVVILFSVILRVLQIVHVIDFLSVIVRPLFQALHIPHPFAAPFTCGLFEITLGSKLLSTAAAKAPAVALALTAFLLAWSGLSIHIQVLSLIGDTDISVFHYILGRLFSGAIAGAVAFLLTGLLPVALPVFHHLGLGFASADFHWTTNFLWATRMFCELTILLAGLGMILSLARRGSVILFYSKQKKR